MKALIVYGGWKGHEPGPVAEVYREALEAEGLEVKMHESLEPLADAEALKALDLVVVNWTMGKIEKAEWQGLSAAVQSGVGVAGTHGGMGDAFREATEFQFMVGGQFVAHPGGIRPYRVHLLDHADPVTAGLDHFDIESEQYYMHVDPTNHVLAASTFPDSGATIPAVWKRTWGAGRVFYSSLGHVAKDFEVPEVRTITLRGFLWAAEGKQRASQ